MDRNQTLQFEADLRRMGINPADVGKKGPVLPSMPASDPDSVSKNRYNGFYKYGSKEFWGDAEVSHDEVQPFVKCNHYMVKINNKLECTQCHAGWIAPAGWHAQDGKLFDGETQLQFAP